jgi:hypothetical protein
MFVAVMALTLGVEIVVFSPARRASRKLLERMQEVRAPTRPQPPRSSLSRPDDGPAVPFAVCQRAGHGPQGTSYASPTPLFSLQRARAARAARAPTIRRRRHWPLLQISMRTSRSPMPLNLGRRIQPGEPAHHVARGRQQPHPQLPVEGLGACHQRGLEPISSFYVCMCACVCMCGRVWRRGRLREERGAAPARHNHRLRYKVGARSLAQNARPPPQCLP